MKLDPSVIDQLAIRPGEPAGLRRRATTPPPDHAARTELEGYVRELERAQELLYATNAYALLVIFQALDAAGKDGTIKHVMSGINPQGCSVESFKQPSREELAHDFLWRAAKVVPARGRIGIFNRSYYEEVLVVRVHPELLTAEGRRPGVKPGKKLWRRRYDDINGFEHHLHRTGTRIVKFFLHVSKDEQLRRFIGRLDDPAKHWKFSAADLAERERWDDYQQAYEDALTATSTRWAPWYVIPADDKPVMRALVAGLLVHTVDQLDLELPALTPEQQAELDSARARLQKML